MIFFGAADQILNWRKSKSAAPTSTDPEIARHFRRIRLASWHRAMTEHRYPPSFRGNFFVPFCASFVPWEFFGAVWNPSRMTVTYWQAMVSLRTA
jgi:hypothetical protein